VPRVQAESTGGSTRSRGRRVSSSLAEINVVPLVDVMLVLLIIFMVTAPMIQRGVDVNLPQARRATTVEGERIFITVPATYHADGMVYMNQERIRADALKERVRQKMETTADKQVYLRGDGAVQLQELMTIFDRLMEAGVAKVGIVTKAPGEI
jgi:biopolymer transport protein TolR